MDTQEDVPFPLLEENNDDVTATPYSGLFTGWTYLYATNIPEILAKTKKINVFPCIVLSQSDDSFF
jgi:hypothetical protein